GALEGLLRLALLGDVTGYLGKALDGAHLVAYRLYDDIRPETCAVLAHTPALALQFAFARSRLQSFLRHARCSIVLGVEQGEVLSDDFLRRVSLDALRTYVPARDLASRVDHVEGMVGHALD